MYSGRCRMFCLGLIQISNLNGLCRLLYCYEHLVYQPMYIGQKYADEALYPFFFKKKQKTTQYHEERNYQIIDKQMNKWVHSLITTNFQSWRFLLIRNDVGDRFSTLGQKLNGFVGIDIYSKQCECILYLLGTTILKLHRRLKYLKDTMRLGWV